MNKVHYDTICLSGGGVKGFAYIGALEHMETNNLIILDSITHWAGTSAGSMLSFIMTLGYSIKDVKEFIVEFNFLKLIPDPKIDNLIENHGIDNGDKIMVIMKNFLKEKYDMDDITYEDHYKLTKKKLTIIGTNYTKGNEAVFNHITTPNMSVLLSIRISISIPIIFTPVLYNEDQYLDGGIVNNFPLNHCNKETTLGLYIKNSTSNKLTNIFTLLVGCVGMFCDTVSRKYCPDINFNDYNIIEIENYDSELTNFNLDLEKKLKIIKLGETSAIRYLERIKNIVPCEIPKNVDVSTQTDEITPTH
jgi:hypothetical protein